MKMKRTSALIALTIALSAGAASAADLKGTASNDSSLFPLAATSRDSLTGFYVGVSGGMDFANTALSYDDSYTYDDVKVPFGAGLDGVGSTGFIGEGQIGYDYQAGKIVFGVFGGGNISNTKTTLDVYEGLDVAKAELTRDWGWYAGPRIGYATSKDTIVYAGGGYTQAVFRLKSDAFKLDASETFEGYFGEVGVETRLSGAVFGKVFGRYVDYNSKSYDDGKLMVDPSELQAMVGLTIKR
jgi:outer membrane immunogenic protein